VILDKFSLKRKTALLTGSSRGLGAGIAMGLAEAGAKWRSTARARYPKSRSKC
jgi:2-deoxy-D-gluconate 3-dehydrogenase